MAGEISIHEVRVFLFLSSHPDRWFSNTEIAEQVAKVAKRTVRAYTLKFTSIGLVDQAEVFPGHRYRWSEKAEANNAAFLARLRRATDVFGLRPGAVIRDIERVTPGHFKAG